MSSLCFLCCVRLAARQTGIPRGSRPTTSSLHCVYIACQCTINHSPTHAQNPSRTHPHCLRLDTVTAMHLQYPAAATTPNKDIQRKATQVKYTALMKEGRDRKLGKSCAFGSTGGGQFVGGWAHSCTHGTTQHNKHLHSDHWTSDDTGAWL